MSILVIPFIILSASQQPRSIPPSKIAAYEDIKKQRESLQKSFEDFENRLLEEQAETDEDASVDEPNTKAKKKAAVENQKSDPKADLTPKKNEVQTAEVENKTPSEVASRNFISRYFTRLGNAYGCFRDFIAALYRARFRRDDEIVKCTTSGKAGCEERKASAFEKQAKTIGDEFKTCIDRPTGTPSLNTASSKD